MNELTLRAKRILQAVVQEYLHTGDAVGSRTVTRRHGIDLSPATVRNVMADLEELGLLHQPHTSAGRVPTHEGLRFFIDSLLKVRSLSPREKEEIRARYTLAGDDVDEALTRTSRLLSELSHQAAIVVTPGPERQRLEQLQFVRLRAGELLAVLVAEGGQIENRVVRFDLPGADPGFLERAHNYLSTLIAGRTLEEARARVLTELGVEKDRLDGLAVQALVLGQAVFAPTASPAAIVSGQAHLLDETEGQGPEHIAEARALLGALEEKERIVALLDRTLRAEGIQVWVGAETPFGELKDVSVVARPYGPEDRPVGSLAVIGPMRMNYSRVIPIVDFTAELLSELMAGRR
jgi:heat-inducible transcriptional repressor